MCILYSTPVLKPWLVVFGWNVLAAFLRSVGLGLLKMALNQWSNYTWLRSVSLAAMMGQTEQIKKHKITERFVKIVSFFLYEWIWYVTSPKKKSKKKKKEKEKRKRKRVDTNSCSGPPSIKNKSCCSFFFITIKVVKKTRIENDSNLCV